MTEQVKHELITGELPCSPKQLIEKLATQDIKPWVVEHPPMFTVAESKSHQPEIEGGLTKNLFVYNKKKQMWLLTLQEDRIINLKQAAKFLSAQNFSFASPQRLMQYLGVKPGSVSPLALVNDTTHQVQFVIDETLLENQYIHVHPLDNCQTATLETSAMLSFLKNTGHNYLTI